MFMFVTTFDTITIPYNLTLQETIDCGLIVFKGGKRPSLGSSKIRNNWEFFLFTKSWKESQRLAKEPEKLVGNQLGWGIMWKV